MVSAYQRCYDRAVRLGLGSVMRCLLRGAFQVYGVDVPIDTDHKDRSGQQLFADLCWLERARVTFGLQFGHVRFVRGSARSAFRAAVQAVRCQAFRRWPGIITMGKGRWLDTGDKLPPDTQVFLDELSGVTRVKAAAAVQLTETLSCVRGGGSVVLTPLGPHAARLFIGTSSGGGCV